MDFVYNFGAFSLLPLALIIGYTGYNVVIFRAQIFEVPGLVGLTFIVLFLIVADNSFKVSFRQPYPGIFAFFMWGLLLERLNQIKLNKVSTK